MRTLTHIITIGLLATATLSGDEKDKKKEPGDSDRLQGAWQMESGERRGRAMPDPERFSLVIKGETITLLRDGEVGFKGTFKIDPAKKPKTMDMELSEDAQGQKKGQVSQGIYSLEGDILKWCNSKPGAEERPGKFATEEGQNFMLAVLKRKKK